MIRLQRSMIAGLQGPNVTVQQVLDALQSAVELEHSTIPLYLYALYSIDASKNAEISAIISSVVIEEMLHMTLASNVMNALGGSPVIDSPGFIPNYPGPLPGGVQSDLTVHLAPFSQTQLQTFLQIEEPEKALDFKMLAAQADVTIGQFYTAISDAIAQLGDGAFLNPSPNQVGPDLMWGSVVVSNVATAQQAITTIIDQGEGTSTSPLEVEGGGYAHYYRFMQIQKGKLLIATPDGGPAPEDKYAYAGAAINFDPTGVYPVATDPGPYKPNTVQSFANDNFNYTYTSLLQSLHALFNGDSSQNRMNTAMGLMMSLKGQAKAMMSGIPDPKVFTSPTFQYQPTNPAN
ncbi:ferritin-like domain-containing protein [Pseudomonas capsici]|uniref:ferritin-like domain-containing protein n=1 Tax=Pseudomonas capsici TaxID=2810614 RepID=UPI0021F18789|nr:ferritin-like protein [Pseudomonas capsici]MCV4263347.1 ferritin-like protein [Pseudomonas capsici]